MEFRWAAKSDMEKLIHQIWLPGFDSCPPSLWPNPAKWEALNPGWRVRLWDGADILKFVEQNYPLLLGIFRSIQECSTDKVAAVKQSDLARLLILHHFGGIYADLDMTPLLPLSSLFGDPFGTSPDVRHRFTEFKYSRGKTQPTVLSEDDEHRELADWRKYELILSREHLPNTELGGYLVSNAFIIAPQPGSKLLEGIISRIVPQWGERVLRFGGPFAISRALKELVAIPKHKGKAYVLPPYFFLWQPHDQGPPWKWTICTHENQLSWCDMSAAVPWNV